MLSSANHMPGYFSNLACDWLSILWAYSEQETENGPWCDDCEPAMAMRYNLQRAGVAICVTGWLNLHWGNSRCK